MTIRDSFLTFGQPDVQQADMDAVLSVLQSRWLGKGPWVQRFEDEFSAYIGTPYGVALGSCTAALHLALLCCGLKAGDEVITSSLTYCATVNAILHAGGVPVLADVDRQTGNISPVEIEKRITPRTKAIIPVHFAGKVCDMDAILAIAKKHRLFVVEDAAHCIEGVYRGKKIGTLGDATCFSFYVTKNITTVEGGLLATPHQDWAERTRVLGLQGMSQDAWKRYSDEGFKHYEVVEPGFKYNMTDIHACIGAQQLNRIEKNLKRREEIWARYDAAFKTLPIVTPVGESEKDSVHARHLYTVLIDKDRTKMNRDEVQKNLFEKKIGTGVHYVAVHLQRYYRERFGFRPEDFPNANYISERTLSLPLSPALTDGDVEDVIEALTSVLRA